jgi:hypothetical protein
VLNMKTPARACAGLVAFLTIPPVLFGILLLTFIAGFGLQEPQPCYGDPCLSPNTWGEVHESVAWMLGIAFATGVVAALGLAAGIYAVADRAPRWRRLALVPVNAVVIVAMLTERWWTG